MLLIIAESIVDVDLFVLKAEDLNCYIISYIFNTNNASIHSKSLKL